MWEVGLECVGISGEREGTESTIMESVSKDTQEESQTHPAH